MPVAGKHAVLREGCIEFDLQKWGSLSQAEGQAAEGKTTGAPQQAIGIYRRTILGSYNKGSCYRPLVCAG